MHKMMMFMPLVFGIMFYGMPSGLVLYFVVSSGLGIIESILIRRHLATLSEAPRPTGQIVPRKKRRDRP
jgi:membrane protein insertase Oxa1/YidC/SpoIIIJ